MRLQVARHFGIAPRGYKYQQPAWFAVRYYLFLISATRTKLCNSVQSLHDRLLPDPYSPLIVTVFHFHYCLVKIGHWLPLYILRIGWLCCPFEKCVCLHACGWKSQLWILNLPAGSYCSHANSTVPPWSNKETDETVCQMREFYFSWQVPSLRHSNRVTSSNVVLAAVPNCRWVWYHAF